MPLCKRAPSLLVVFSDWRCSRPFCYLPCPLSLQLVDLPSNINGIQSLCQVFFAGPGNWTSMHDAQHLRCKWHFPIEIDDFHILPLAIRVQMASSRGATRRSGSRIRWWFGQLSFSSLVFSQFSLCPLEGCFLGDSLSGYWSWRFFYKLLTKGVSTNLWKALKQKNLTPYCVILRLQDKFERWRLSERGNIACRRALRCLQHISKHSRPAIVIAILRVWRMWDMPLRETTQRCKLGCQLCEDSIEHYIFLPCLLEILLLPPSPWFGTCFQAQIKGNIVHGEFWFMRERCSEIGSWLMQFHALQFVLVGHITRGTLQQSQYEQGVDASGKAGSCWWFQRFQGNLPAFPQCYVVWHWHADPFTIWNLRKLQRLRGKLFCQFVGAPSSLCALQFSFFHCHGQSHTHIYIIQYILYIYIYLY